ncbi:DNA polymerase-like [Cryptomeria japonica]|uniref:DNA polymerase-like n=1 Tax=Cryptomeria japonica TaxID=3369 RepID=UPI0027DA80D3|nr:DNA polymerase-like [Cryptomeria japonica]
MTIFRTNYYDPISWPIHIPSRNEDTFIRRGYYGDHADTYKPYGEKLYYYDVNSLYPYVMKSFPMPGGMPVWHANLEGQELSNLYGFIKAYVVCPSTIKRPFLPYRDHNDTLLFPTGKFVGVYFSEELIYARDLGYKIFPIRGYLFDKKPSPFDSFVTSLFGRRQEAKLSGDEAMAYGYKILMNSVYGRFSINPKSTITEYYIVCYVSNTSNVEDKDWNPPKILAVQLAAAIIAHSRIHMYKYISKPDCYYTDRDSAILGSPLPDDDVSPFELGKLKIEHFVKKGIFLAPKSYTLITEEASDIIKHKGPAKDLVNVDWFKSQYTDLSRTQQITVESNFRIDWHILNIAKKSYQINLGIKLGSKREPIYDNNNVWVDTQPKDVTDFASQESAILRFELMILRELLEKKDQEYTQRLDKKDKEYACLQKEYAKSIAMQKEYAKSIASLESDLASLESELAKQCELIQSLSAAAKPPTQSKHPTT